ncbi:gliding motility lipoprotein GldD [Sungkyunkwania multivorans]|uniref:Gliding motility lipoprotein GldD n=1 Tax=Sungkyunkwania multivorans TaxID=1173618 RepID=A0ABW3D081_9FLAO
MRLKQLFSVILFTAILGSCGDEVLPKPKAYLQLEYPAHQYETLRSKCPYIFEKSVYAKLEDKGKCWVNLVYPKMKATIYLSYYPVTNNIDSLLRDAQKLALDHTIKAQGIIDQPFVNPDDKVYGNFYSIQGDAASQSHFYLTDSTDHFFTGSLYFYSKPNYDSIYPAAVYLQKDIRKIMESFRWKE